MHGVLRHIAIAFGILLFATHANALGLGNLTVDSKLGEPLAARIALNGAEGMTAEELIVNIADVDTYERMGIEREYIDTLLRFTTRIDSKTGTYEILVTTRDSLRIPLINFVLHVKWPKGNAMKSYTILLDTPLGN